jgi:hypothetical protein
VICWVNREVYVTLCGYLPKRRVEMSASRQEHTIFNNTINNTISPRDDITLPLVSLY